MNRRFLRRHRSTANAAVAVAEAPPAPAAPGAEGGLGVGLIYDAFVGSPMAMAMIATDGSLLRCNAAWLTFVGARSETDVTGARLVDYVHSRDRGMLKAALASFAAGEPSSWKQELRFTCEDGRVAWGQSTLSVVRDGRGRPLMIFAHVDDVTKRRQADRLRDVRRSISENLAGSNEVAATCAEVLRLLCAGLAWDAGAVWLVDEKEQGASAPLRCQAAWGPGGPLDPSELPGADRGARHVASALARNTTVARSDEPVAWETPLHEAVPHTWFAGACFPLRAGDRVLGLIELYRQDPEFTHPQLSAWLTVVGEQVGGCIARKHHESELERLSAELERHAEELERSNYDLERYAGIVSHDLSQPLRVVGGYASLLLRRHGEALDDEGRGYLSRMVRGADRMQMLIDDLLEYARVGSGPLVSSTVETGALAESVAQALQPLVDAAGAKVEVASLPAVAGDARQLERVFDNVIGNALKFRSDDPPHVVVEATREGDVCHFTVTDNGVGIAPDQRERAVEMFQRLVPADASPGSGMGLAICVKIVERHGGRLWLDGSPSGGTVVHFDLPAAGGER